LTEINWPAAEIVTGVGSVAWVRPLTVPASLWAQVLGDVVALPGPLVVIRVSGQERGSRYTSVIDTVVLATAVPLKAMPVKPTAPMLRGKQGPVAVI
jgi:hypothetical protein